MSRAATIDALRARTAALTLTKYVALAPDGTRLVKRVLKVDANEAFMGIQKIGGRWRANGVRFNRGRDLLDRACRRLPQGGVVSDERKDPTHCTRCKVPLGKHWIMCDEQTGEFCNVCIQVVCLEQHSEGCSTGVWSSDVEGAS